MVAAVNQELIESLRPIWTRRISDRAVSALELLETMIRAYGVVHRKDHELRAGERVLNDDRELLPRVARCTSLGLSLYLGNRRIASFAVLDAGAAGEVGGFADAALVDAVLRKRETFRGTLVLDGRRHLVACRPLMSLQSHDDYGPLGMIEAYQDLDSLDAMVDTGLREGVSGRPGPTFRDHADRMEDVMHFIDDVGRRLQLLALNGNILAAQAGDHGRAFRVVCRELGSLAAQSKEAVARVRRLTQELLPEEDDPPPGFVLEEPTPDPE